MPGPFRMPREGEETGPGHGGFRMRIKGTEGTGKDIAVPLHLGAPGAARQFRKMEARERMPKAAEGRKAGPGNRAKRAWIAAGKDRIGRSRSLGWSREEQGRSGSGHAVSGQRAEDWALRMGRRESPHCRSGRESRGHLVLKGSIRCFMPGALDAGRSTGTGEHGRTERIPDQ